MQHSDSGNFAKHLVQPQQLVKLFISDDQLTGKAFVVLRQAQEIDSAWQVVTIKSDCFSGNIIDLFDRLTPGVVNG